MSKNNKIWFYALGFALIIGLTALPFLLQPAAPFLGTDNLGSDTVKALSPGYRPWFSSFWQPPPEIEATLFAVQAAIGAGIIGYFIGYVRGRSATGGSDE